MKRTAAIAAALLLLMGAFFTGCGTVGKPSDSTSAGGPENTGKTEDKGETTKPSEETDLITVSLADTSEVLVNPGKGFMHYGDTGYARTKELMFLIGTGYHRFNWCDLMTDDGQYDFTKIRDWMKTYTKFGRPFGFGVMAVNTSSSKEYITPKYVFGRGAKSFTHKEGSNTQIIPDWKDPIFLEEVKRLATELGQAFNGDENVSFVEILSYGNWGEQHLFHIEVEGYPDYREKESISPEFFKEHYAQPYLDAFPDTILYNPWGTEDFDEVYLELADKGIALRRDGIVKYTNGLDTLAATYGKLPTAFEFAESYKHFIEDGTNETFNQRLEEAITIAKPSYIEFDPDWYAQNEAYAHELANRMGYYFRLKEAKIHSDLRKNGEMTLRFRNDGVAPIYEPCCVAIGLLDADGKEVKRFPTSCDPSKWMPDEEKEERFTIDVSSVPAGRYTLAVGLFRSEADAFPIYLVGSDGKTESNWYTLTPITL